MFWATLDERRIDVLRKIVTKMPVKESYLAGGTALALQIGHRKSYDFDWFTSNSFNPDAIQQQLETLGMLKDVSKSKGTFHGNLENVRVTWLNYPNPLVKPLQETEEMPGLKVASLEDIGLMKMVAISSRGAKRDFVDLYYICQKEIKLEGLIQQIPKKFPYSEINIYHIIKSLIYFDDAEKDVLDGTDILWDKVKKYFIEKQPKIIEQINGK